MLECLYHNESDHMVILKCLCSNQFYREKVILPFESYWFEAPQESRLEIWKMSVTGQFLHLRADAKDYQIDTPLINSVNNIEIDNAKQVLDLDTSSIR